MRRPPAWRLMRHLMGAGCGMTGSAAQEFEHSKDSAVAGAGRREVQFGEDIGDIFLDRAGAHLRAWTTHCWSTLGHPGDGTHPIGRVKVMATRMTASARIGVPEMSVHVGQIERKRGSSFPSVICCGRTTSSGIDLTGPPGLTLRE